MQQIIKKHYKIEEPSPKGEGKRALDHIGVLMGGYSSEREISLKSGKAVLDALQAAGYRASGLDLTAREEERILETIQTAAIDVAFIALHGRLGEDGTIQSILERAAIPYPGSGVAASRLAINKAKTQSLLKAKGIPVADFAVVINEAALDIAKILQNLTLPLVVKPACEGSSIGIVVVREKENLEVALREAFRYGNEVLVERYLPGKELTVGILGNGALPVVEICPKNKFFDFTAKYQPGMTDYVVPAAIPRETAILAQQAAWAAHEALGCEDFSRVDIILDENGSPHVLEVNTIPGFTATSLLPKAARAAGLDFTELCLKLIRSAYEKKK